MDSVHPDWWARKEKVGVAKLAGFSGINNQGPKYMLSRRENRLLLVKMLVACVERSYRKVRITLNISSFKRPSVGEEWNLQQSVTAQVSSPSLDHDSKLLSQSSKALRLLNSATLMFTHYT
ncbi:hypothetical protein TNCV_3959701 [Trichonephila clavipes]|nr:hypothetical protein TNCV_3959701 [Trichonephila clavipes]